MTDYATLLRDHVTLKIRSLDRVLLQGYVPQLQTVGYVCRFLRWQRNFPIPSSAAFGKIGQQYVRAIHRFAQEHNIPRLKFEEGQDNRKNCCPLLTGCGQARSRSSCPHWIGTRKGLHLEILATPRSGKSRPPPHGLGPTDGLHRSFLLLLVGSTMGWDLLQDQRLGSFSQLALAQRP